MSRPVPKMHYHINSGIGGDRMSTANGKYGRLELEQVNLRIPDGNVLIILIWIYGFISDFFILYS